MKYHRVAPSVATALAAAVLVAGCSGHRSAPTGSSAAPASCTPAWVGVAPAAEGSVGPPQLPPGCPAPSVPPMDTDPASAAPTAPAAGAMSAEDAAVAVVSRYLLKGAPSQAAWWAEVAPYFAADARAAYQPTDPAAVPGSTVTGWPTRAPAVSTALATVTVPTDAGPYGVLLAVQPDGTWAAERLILPPGTH